MTKVIDQIPGDTTSVFSSDPTILTPPTEPSDSWNGRYYTIPWHGNVYVIQEKASGQALYTNADGNIWIDPIEDEGNEYMRWYCVEKNGYFGFKNQKTGKYLGHNGGDHIIASAGGLQPWELFTTRNHPDGGYQLLMPHYWHTLLVLSVAENGKGLHRRDHGATVWEFIKV